MNPFGPSFPAPRQIQIPDASLRGPWYVDADHVLANGHTVGFSVADDTAAAKHIAAAAEQILRVIPHDARHAVVTGRGMLAALVAAALPPTADHQRVPDVVVDTTGDPEVLSRSVQGLADLGSLLLAGPSGGRTWALDTYPDVHSRGLRLRGLTGFGDLELESYTDELGFVERALPALSVPDERGTLPAGWTWCRLGDA